MKKLLMMIVVLGGVFTLGACDMVDSTEELPDVHTWHIDEARAELQDLGFEVYPIGVNESFHSFGQPDLVVRYQDYEPGNEVETGTVLSILISDFEEDPQFDPAPRTPIDHGGAFIAPEDVALYLDTYEELPQNYVSSETAEEEGWSHAEDDLHDYFDDAIIGGDEWDEADAYDAIPHEDRTFYQAWVNYEGGINASPEAFLVYSDDGLIYSTDDNFETFTQHFGNEEHPPLDADERYTDLEDVMLYIRTFGKLPPNYIIRKEEHVNNYQSLYGYTPDYADDYDFPRNMGDMRDEHGEDAYFGYWTFSNRGGQMPDTSQFYMADIAIAYPGTSRGSTRIVFSPEEKIAYYTPDHYNTFELWYGDARED